VRTLLRIHRNAERRSRSRRILRFRKSRSRPGAHKRTRRPGSSVLPRRPCRTGHNFSDRCSDSCTGRRTRSLPSADTHTRRACMFDPVCIASHILRNSPDRPWVPACHRRAGSRRRFRCIRCRPHRHTSPYSPAASTRKPDCRNRRGRRRPSWTMAGSRWRPCRTSYRHRSLRSH
jgi:hypothetical protein